VLSVSIFALFHNTVDPPIGTQWCPRIRRAGGWLGAWGYPRNYENGFILDVMLPCNFLNYSTGDINRNILFLFFLKLALFVMSDDPLFGQNDFFM
jgi:hypothetical protein